MWSSPSIAPNGDIYIATQEYGGILYRIDGTTGAILDQADTRGTVEHTPAIADNGIIYLNTLRQQLHAGSIYPIARAGTEAFDAATLDTLWFVTQPGGIGGGDFASDNSPIIGRNNRVYTGYVLWPGNGTVTSAPVNAINSLTGTIEGTSWTPGWVACPGVADEDGHLYYGAEDSDAASALPLRGGGPIFEGDFICFDGTDAMNILWSHHAEGDFGSPVGYCDGIVYTTCRDGNLYGFDKDTGAIFAQHYLDAPTWTGSTIGRSTSSNNPIIYTATGMLGFTYSAAGATNRIIAIEVDSATGATTELWSYHGQGIGGSFSFGNPLLDDQGDLYFTDGGGFVYCLDATTGAQQWMASSGSPGSCLAGPTMTNDGLLICTQADGKIVAYNTDGNHVNDDLPWPKYKRNLRATSNLHDPIRDLFYLETPVLTAGSPSTMTVQGSTSNVFLGYSLSGPGHQPIPALDCVSFLDGAQLLATLTPNAAGISSVTKTPPLAAAGLNVYLEAFTANEESMVVHTVIQ